MSPPTATPATHQGALLPFSTTTTEPLAVGTAAETAPDEPGASGADGAAATCVPDSAPGAGGAGDPASTDGRDPAAIEWPDSASRRRRFRSASRSLAVW